MLGLFDWVLRTYKIHLHHTISRFALDWLDYQLDHLRIPKKRRNEWVKKCYQVSSYTYEQHPLEELVIKSVEEAVAAWIDIGCDDDDDVDDDGGIREVLLSPSSSLFDAMSDFECQKVPLDMFL
jgi:hypothetical protein